MARVASAILTATEQKTVDAVTATKAELKLALASQKELDKAVGVATKAAAKVAAGVTKLQAKLTKLQPTKPEVLSATHGTGTGVGAVAKAA